MEIEEITSPILKMQKNKNAILNQSITPQITPLANNKNTNISDF